MKISLVLLHCILITSLATPASIRRKYSKSHRRRISEKEDDQESLEQRRRQLYLLYQTRWSKFIDTVRRQRLRQKSHECDSLGADCFQPSYSNSNENSSSTESILSVTDNPLGFESETTTSQLQTTAEKINRQTAAKATHQPLLNSMECHFLSFISEHWKHCGTTDSDLQTTTEELNSHLFTTTINPTFSDSTTEEIEIEPPKWVYQPTEAPDYYTSTSDYVLPTDLV